MKGESGEAEQWYLRALAIKEKVLGPHPDVAMTLNNLAVVYKAQGKLGQAELLYQRALAIFEQVLEPHHPKIVTCRANYASLLRQMHREAEAMAMESRTGRA